MSVSREYRQAYIQLGEERVQEVNIPTDEQPLVKLTKREEARNRKRGVTQKTTEWDLYWDHRLDDRWGKMPGFFRRDRRKRTQVFWCTIPIILVHLEPANTFNPAEVWETELERQHRERTMLSAGGNRDEGAVVAHGAVNKKDKIKAEITASNAFKRLVAEVTHIRNSKNDLMSIIRKTKFPEARAFLIVQILKQAYDEYRRSDKREKKLLYETLWAIDSIGGDAALPREAAPLPTNPRTDILPTVKDYSLVYDNIGDVEKLLRDARKVMNKEQDLVKLQLIDMADSLPPLTKFSFGFRLDEWQKRVLTWIDAGKSVVICAPTSSGKTVLSSYVAIIFKSHVLSDGAVEAEGRRGRRAIAGVNQEDGTDGAGNIAGNAGGAAAAAGEDEGDFEEVDGEDMDGEDGGWEDGNFGDEGSDNDDEEEEEDGDEDEDDHHNHRAVAGEDEDALIRRLVAEDRARRNHFRANRAQLANSSGLGGRTGEGSSTRVLFCVPTEPLVWQVAAYFTKLLREEGDKDTKVAIVTDQLTYNPPKKFELMPQIVVGTPLALESALTKCRGVVGKWEACWKRPQGDTLPGGFDHFEWVVYDEVHSLDGREGAALQRLIRSMNCKFLALSATVGNAEELRGWMERVKGDYIAGVESITVTAEDTPNATAAATTIAAAPADATPPASSAGNADGQQQMYTVKVIKSLTCESTVLAGVTAETTVLQLKQRICEVWPTLVDPATQQVPHTQYPLQLLCGPTDLAAEDKTLGSYGIFNGNGSEAAEGEEDVVIHLRSYVHLLTHEGRFINLQRYVWNQAAPGGARDKLQVVSPMLAVDSVSALQKGVLDNSSLSFTSRDSFCLWEKIKTIFPQDLTDPSSSLPEVIRNMNPYTFFGAKERITLQRTKDYEDLLKTGLRVLAERYPKETQELLYAFTISDAPKEFDLCELVLELKARDMTPCLPFHLNSFEAIRLFQQLLAGMEWRQKEKYPTYYQDQKKVCAARRTEVAAQVKSTGKNAKALEEAKKAGDIDVNQSFSVDEYAPHPSFLFSKAEPLSEPELAVLVDEMERNDGFERRDKSAMTNLKGKNIGILKHALVRGLRRGIGLFINEVSFPAYRRAVQRLASQGKLAVVISDDSLAFGVNMPFRTCIFCGSMFGELDELMAAQMSGRAGRRGLDTQGNLVYAGMTVSNIRRLMIGTVAHITGRNTDPRYHTMFLQSVLSPRHVGWSRAEVLGGRTLLEQVEGRGAPAEKFTMDTSRRAMEQLGLVVYDASRGQFVPNSDRQCTYALLSLVWELRDNVHESITMALVFPDLMEEFDELTKDFSFSEKKQNKEKNEQYLLRFFCIFTILFGRRQYKPSSTHHIPLGGTGGVAVPLREVTYLHNPAHMEVVTEWSERFREAQEHIPEELAPVLRDPVAPGVEIDGTFFQCILDRNFVHTLDDEMKQRMKAEIWHAGNVLRLMKNCSWPEDSYNRVANFIFRDAFEKVKYLNAELIRAKIDFENVSEAERERRVDATAQTTKGKSKALDRPPEAKLWCDNDDMEIDSMHPNLWCSAVERALERCAGPANAGDAAAVTQSLQTSIEAFQALGRNDLPLLELCAKLRSSVEGQAAAAAGNLQSVAKAVCSCSFASKGSLGMSTSTARAGTGSAAAAIQSDSTPESKAARIIGVLTWLCLVGAPPALQLSKVKFLAYLKTIYDAEDGASTVVDEDAVRAWYTGAYASLLPQIPSSYLDFPVLAPATPATSANPAGGNEADQQAVDKLADAAAQLTLSVPVADNVVSEAALSKLKASCVRFIEWLDEEEEEDDDDDDEEDE